MEEFLRKNGMKSKPVILGVVLGVKLNTAIVVVLAVEIKISFKHVYVNLGVKIATIAMEHFHTKQMHLSLSSICLWSCSKEKVWILSVLNIW